MELVFGRFVDLLIRNQVVPTEDKAIYVYGFQQGCIILLNILTTIGIGVLFSRVIESVVFLLVYMPLRSYAGGYHAKTPLQCYLFSVFMMIVVLWMIGLPIWSGIAIAVSMVIAIGIIFYFAPVAAPNKPLSQNEIQVYKKVTYRIVGILVGLVLLFQTIEQYTISTSIVVALCIVACMLIIGKWYYVKKMDTTNGDFSVN